MALEASASAAGESAFFVSDVPRQAFASAVCTSSAFIAGEFAPDVSDVLREASALATRESPVISAFAASEAAFFMSSAFCKPTSVCTSEFNRAEAPVSAFACAGGAEISPAAFCVSCAP